MKTQCPHCRVVQDIPDHYQDKPIKCPKCRKRFPAILYFPAVETPTPISPPSSDPFPFSPAPWNALYVLATLGIIVSVIGAISYGSSLTSSDWANRNYGQPFVSLIDVILFGISLIGVLLSCILIAIGYAIHHLDTLAKNSQKP